MNKYIPKNPEEYVSCVRQLAALLNKAMEVAATERFVSEDDKKKSLQRLAQGVETVASLRGDSGLFYAARPEGLTVFQKEMYGIEDELRNKLMSLGYKYPSP